MNVNGLCRGPAAHPGRYIGCAQAERLARIFLHKSPASNPTRCETTGKYLPVLDLLTVTWRVSSIFLLSASNILTTMIRAIR